VNLLVWNTRIRSTTLIDQPGSPTGSRRSHAAAGPQGDAAIEADSEVKANALIAPPSTRSKKIAVMTRASKLSVSDGNDKVAKRLDRSPGGMERRRSMSPRKGHGGGYQRGATRAALAVTSELYRQLHRQLLEPDSRPDLDSYWLMDIAIVKAPTIGVDAANGGVDPHCLASRVIGPTGSTASGYADRCEPEHRSSPRPSISPTANRQLQELRDNPMSRCSKAAFERSQGFGGHPDPRSSGTRTSVRS